MVYANSPIIFGILFFIETITTTNKNDIEYNKNDAARIIQQIMKFEEEAQSIKDRALGKKTATSTATTNSSNVTSFTNDKKYHNNIENDIKHALEYFLLWYI